VVGRFLFNNRDGRTPLPDEWKKDLVPILKHLKIVAELDEVEEENIIEGLIWLDDCKDDGLDWMFWFKLHKKMFNNVWKWAGKFRDRELANDDFNHPGYIQQNIKKLEGDLKFWLSRDAKMDQQEAMARFHIALLTIHPFSNGNGRTTRILTDYICKRQGFSVPTWGLAHRGDAKEHRQVYINSVLKARREGDFSEMIRFMFGS
jgi:Fic-DOC domain mobile mystery protein B